MIFVPQRCRGVHPFLKNFYATLGCIQKVRVRITGVLFVLLLLSTVHADESYIAEKSNEFKRAFLPVDITRPAQQWVLPFVTADRRDIKTIQVISRFGDFRSSRIKGHKHTGVDIVPRSLSNDYIWVYPIGNGVVCSIHLDHPHITIVVKHKTNNGEIIYSSYKHLYAPLVKLCDAVSINTKLGRIYTPVEGRRLNCDYSHLHLEIRKEFDDFGVASWATMTANDLHRRFYDPLAFFKDNL